MEFDKMCMIPGYAYISPQKLSRTYDCDKALEQGTLFPTLDLPLGVYGKQDISEKCEEIMKMEGEK